MAKARKKTQKPADRTPDEWRHDILDAVMVHVPFDGWSGKSLAEALKDLNLDPGIARLAFPDGIREIVEAYLKRVDRQMMAALEGIDPESLSIRQRIACAVKTRLELHQDQRPLVERTVAYLALPFNADLSLCSLWRTSDLIWRWAGDTATDYNHYSKRAILSAVYSSTLLYWLNDESVAAADTWGFLDRRIENVMQFEKLKARLRKAAEKMPNLARELGRLRYGE
ncbi:MAG: COQ9 family protein [Proteobacteria bacterium]|nr:COQ9 family protein [Pseudomonadota bacterium]